MNTTKVAMFEQELSQCSGRITDRQYIANLVLKHPDLFNYAINKLLEAKATHVQRLCWSLDIAYKQDPHAFKASFLAFFKALAIQKSDSALRSLLKIISQMLQQEEYLALMAHCAKEKKALISQCFVFLTQKHEVAVQVYAMEILYHLRHEQKWISETLCDILNNELEWGSAAYRARGLKILKKINKERNRNR